MVSALMSTVLRTDWLMSLLWGVRGRDGWMERARICMGEEGGRREKNPEPDQGRVTAGLIESRAPSGYGGHQLE